MAREIPEVVRAAAGLAAIVLDEARKLPETLPGLPVRVIGLAMQQAMKVQQQYAGFVARGDELFTGLRGEDEPGLATFDDEIDDAAPANGGGFRESAFDRADVPLEEVHLTEDTTPDPTDLGDSDLPPVDLDSLDESAALPPAKRTTARRTNGRQTAVKETDLGDSDLPTVDLDMVDESAALPPAKRAAAKKTTAKKAPGKTAPAKTAAGKKTAPPTKAAAKATAQRPPRKGAPVADAAAQVEEAQQALDTLPAEAPATDEVLEELAIDEMVAEAPPAEAAEPDVTADVSTTTDVLTAEGDVAQVEATVTDEGIAAPEAPDEDAAPVAAATGVRTDEGGPDTAEEDAAIATGAEVDAVGAESAAPTDDPEGGSELSGSQAAGTAPIEGYDGFSIAQLRGRLRGYALSTVSDLVAYEESTRAREPYLRMLRNRLERLEAQAVESSPLAPRGA